MGERRVWEDGRRQRGRGEGEDVGCGGAGEVQGGGGEVSEAADGGFARLYVILGFHSSNSNSFLDFLKIAPDNMECKGNASDSKPFNQKKYCNHENVLVRNITIIARQPTTLSLNPILTLPDFFSRPPSSRTHVTIYT